ncbi:UDP-N-acetylmuramate dehydrogenase [Jeotgalibaca sp. YN-L-12]|nr:UDP-N-acetylmuramate dehydrogenase [Jeotgalibaca caeni]MDE1549022.1 UDP-N-acetylmuramate dehydrogenase [Jeotgalibaca caeni]
MNGSSEGNILLDTAWLAEEIKGTFPNVILKVNKKLDAYTYTRTGGPADVLLFPVSKEEVEEITKWTHEHKVPLTILGNSSNVIIRDGGIRGVVMILTELNGIKAEKNQLIVQSGAKLIDASKRALHEGLTGLEFACGIPGSVGGAVYMNAGAYGGEVKTVIKTVEVVTLKGERKVYENDDLEFNYRHTVLQETGDIVLETVFELEKGKKEKISAKMEELTELRTAKQPLEFPSCGSVFKRPTGYFTGKLIQEAGLQGKMWGGAQISTKHAGFIVNVNQASATDYIELIAYIKEVIFELFEVKLETEVRIIGEDAPKESDDFVAMGISS